MTVLRDHDKEGRMNWCSKYPQVLFEEDKTHLMSYTDLSALDFLRKETFKMVIQFTQVLQGLFSVSYMHVAAAVHLRIPLPFPSTLSTFEVVHQNAMKQSIEQQLGKTGHSKDNWQEQLKRCYILE